MFDPVPRSHMFMIDARRMSGSGSGSSVARSSVADGVPIRANNPLIVEGIDPVLGDISEIATRLYRQRFDNKFPNTLQDIDNPATEVQQSLKYAYDRYLDEFVQFCFTNRRNHNLDTMLEDKLHEIFENLRNELRDLLPLINNIG